MRPEAFIFSCGLLFSLSLAGCSGEEADARIDGDVLVTIEQAANGPWRVTYEFAHAEADVDLGPDIGGYRAANWKLDGKGALLLHRDGHDFITPVDGRRRIKAVSVVVDPAPIGLHKDYEPFIPMGDGGVLFYSGHFMPFESGGERMRAKLTVIASKGAHVSAFGETAERIENWESPYKHPAFIYVGPGTISESEALLTITDATAPKWLSDEISVFAPAIGKSLQGLLQRALPTKPNIFVAMGDLSEEGRLSYSGDALPGQYQMTLAGGAWKQASPQALSVLRQTTAHEAAHLWQAAARPKSDAVPDWIHEGGADALAAEAMLAAGYWTDDDATANLDEARLKCSASLEQLSLQRAEADENWDAVYACGQVLNVAAAGDAGVAAFWREFVRRTAVDGYDEAAFLALALEMAGEDRVKAIRSLIRINDARPDLAISRMLN